MHTELALVAYLPADQEAAYKGATYGWRKFFGDLERVLDQEAA